MEMLATAKFRNIGLLVSSLKSMYMVSSTHHNVSRNHIKVANKSFEILVNFKLGTTVTNKSDSP